VSPTVETEACLQAVNLPAGLESLHVEIISRLAHRDFSAPSSCRTVAPSAQSGEPDVLERLRSGRVEFGRG
jgi:hypothetical protein